MKSQNKKFLLNIDIITEEDGMISLEGWVISPSQNPLFSIKDASSNTVTVDVERTSRPDVSQIILGDDSHADCGFKLRFTRTAASGYTLFVSDSGQMKKSRFNLEGFSHDGKYNDSKHILHSIGPGPKATLRTVREEGLYTYLKQLMGDCRQDKYRYHVWLTKHLPNRKVLSLQKKEGFPYSPKISLIVPAYQTPKQFLKEMIESVREQTYTNWELCIADGSYPDTAVAEVLKEYSELDSRIRYTVLTENKGISGNTNAALAMAEGEWIALMDHDDTLAPSALYEIVKRMNEDLSIDVIYTDEDKVSLDMRTYFSPAFKPDFDPELLCSTNYICHLFCVKKSIVDAVGEFDSACDGSQDYDFILRCTEHAEKVNHLARVLYHWRSHPNSTAAAEENKMYCYEAGVHAIQKHLDRCHIPAHAYMNAHLGHYCLFYEPEETPLISVILWGKITKENVQKTEASILETSPYRNYEFLYGKKSISEAKGKYLFFIKSGATLNSFCIQSPTGRTFSEDMIQKHTFPYNMLGMLAEPQTGAVGGRVLDADDTLFYAGIVRNRHHAVDYSFRLEPQNSIGYLARPFDTQRTAAASLCCMMIRKDAFDAAGGLDETLASAFDDIALCYQLTQMGYYHLYTPTVTVRLGSPQGRAMHIRYPMQAKQVAARFADLLAKSDPNFSPNQIIHFGKWELRE